MGQMSSQHLLQVMPWSEINSRNSVVWLEYFIHRLFSIWFIHLPSHVLSTPSKAAYSTLLGAYELLVKMQKLRLHPADEVCYRVMMQLCGAHSQPVLAVKVLFEMKRHGVQPNAITYGFYNKAVLEAHWSSDMANHSQLLWNKLKYVYFSSNFESFTLSFNLLFF